MFKYVEHYLSMKDITHKEANKVFDNLVENEMRIIWTKNISAEDKRLLEYMWFEFRFFLANWELPRSKWACQVTQTTNIYHKLTGYISIKKPNTQIIFKLCNLDSLFRASSLGSAKVFKKWIDCIKNMILSSNLVWYSGRFVSKQFSTCQQF